MFKWFPLKNRIRCGTNVGTCRSLSAGFLFDDTEDCGRNGAGRAAAAVSCRDGYLKVSGADASMEETSGPKNHRYPPSKVDFCLNRTLVEPTKRHVPLYLSCVTFWRTFPSFPPILTPSNPRSDPGSPRFVFIRNYAGNASRTEPLYRTKTGYYDLLGVSPSATQAQIKTAYYKQSFAYHPDRNRGSEEATERFTEISEAYAVLGNKGLRKKYDRGLLSLSDLTGRTKPSSGVPTGGSAERQAAGRRSVMGTDLREKVFDFDRFYKAHYGDQLQRQRDLRLRKEEMLRRKQDNVGDKKLGRMTEIGVGVLLVFAVGILLSLGQ